MADLTLEVALGLAGSLVNIGHPYSQAAVQATALCLIKWCKGGILEGVPRSPELQAQLLVEEACETWTAGWPERGGTAALLALFKARFAPKPKEWTQEQRIAHAIATGWLAAPCQLCKAEGQPYCEHGSFARHQRANAEAAESARVVIDVPATAPAPPKKRLTCDAQWEQLAAHAQASYEDEQRRKRDQLAALEAQGVL